MVGQVSVLCKICPIGSVREKSLLVSLSSTRTNFLYWSFQSSDVYRGTVSADCFPFLFNSIGFHDLHTVLRPTEFSTGFSSLYNVSSCLPRTLLLSLPTILLESCTFHSHFVQIALVKAIPPLSLSSAAPETPSEALDSVVQLDALLTRTLCLCCYRKGDCCLFSWRLRGIKRDDLKNSALKAALKPENVPLISFEARGGRGGAPD